MEIAGYTVDLSDLLGRGGFGDVFVATDENNTRVAAKRVWLRTAYLVDIKAEVETLKNIEPHKNILKFIHSESSKDCLWIFTEYCEKGDLSKYCETHELEFTHKVDIAYQCLCAIHHLHGLTPSTVHRDVKPNNILMAHKDSQLEVKLADFGLAKTATLIGETLAMRSICGTEVYMAPEYFLIQRKAAFSYGRSVDIYAMGMVLAELLEATPGKPLLPIKECDMSLGEVMSKMKQKSLPVWCPVTLDMDDDDLMFRLKAIISAMLTFNPRCRPSAQTAMLKLKAILDVAPKSGNLPRCTEDEDEQELDEEEGTEDQKTVCSVRDDKSVRLNPDYKTIRPKPDDKTIGPKPDDETIGPEPDDKTIGPEPDDEAIGPKPDSRTVSPKPETVSSKADTKAKQKFKNKARGHNIRSTFNLGKARAHGQALGAITRLRGLEYKFILVGGSRGYNTLDVCWELDTPPHGFFWKCFAKFPDAIRGQHGHSICSIDDNSFAIAGGSSTSQYESVCYMYSVKSKWKKLPNAITARCSAGLVCLNDALHFLGGEGNDKTILKSCEKLDLKLVARGSRWVSCEDMIQEMVFPLAATAGNSIYVVSNTHKDNQIQPGTALTLQCFDPNSKRWSYRAALPNSIQDTSGSAIVGDGEFLYLLAGWERLCAHYSVEVDSWTLLQPCRAVHSFAAACCSDRKINVFGGKDERGATTLSVSEYDIDKDEWRERALEMPEPSVYHCALVLLMQGGGTLEDVEEN